MAEHAAPSKFKFNPSIKVRAYIYSVGVAAGPVVTYYGWMTAQEVALWLGFGATALAVPSALALANLPKGGANG